MKPYMLITDTETFAFSAENPTGARGGGIPGENVKLRPNIRIAPGETAVLADLDGPGMIQHIWFTGYVGHSFILRIYWDGQEYRSLLFSGTPMTKTTRMKKGSIQRSARRS